MIIGVVGPLGAGKSTVVDYLSAKRHSLYRFSDVIIEKSELREPTRKQYQDCGNKLRKKFGNDFLAKEIWRKIKKSKTKISVLDGFRNLGEVEFFKEKKDFYLIFINSKQRIRFDRLRKRGSSKDPKNWEDFVIMEERDLGEKEDWGQQNKAAMSMADIKIENNGTKAKLFLDVDKVLQKISK